ncbi:MAG: glycosyltransferase [Bryobacteraceae bacterium]|nr:glycosyltransferase [Bryobacteraceae bacterium]
MLDSSGSGISVIIPYYNREQFIDEAIQSVLAQTLQPLEIIIVNDGSRESSRRYLDRYAGVCTIIDMSVNAGSAAARNEGIRRARGHWIAFQDDDDIWLPEKLAIEMRYMEEHPACDAVQSAVWAFFANKPDQMWGFDRPSPLTLADALTCEYSVMQQTMLISTESVRAVGGYDPRFRRVQDYEFFIRYAAAGHRLESIREPLARLRRQGHECATQHRWSLLFKHLRLLWKHKALYHRVFGMRGIVRYVLVMLERRCNRMHIAGGAMRALLRLLPNRLLSVSCRVRTDYQEPVGRILPAVQTTAPRRTK